MQRACDSCQVVYEAKRRASRFCSERCRKRAQRGHVVALPATEPERPAESSGLRAAVLGELAAAGREQTALGQAALGLAVRIEQGADTGSAVASLVRELRATLAEALADARPVSALDELKARRIARLSG
jgi:hypothetical protein